MDDVRKLWMTTRVVALALLGVPLVMIVVAFVASQTGEPAEPSPDPMMIYAITAVALIEIPVLLFVRRMMMGGLALGGPDEMAISRAEPAPLPEATSALEHAARRYYTGTVVGLSLGVSIAIYGVVLAVLYQQVMLSLPFVAVALVVNGVQMPRWSAVLSVVPPEVAKTARQERIEP